MQGKPNLKQHNLHLQESLSVKVQSQPQPRWAQALTLVSLVGKTTTRLLEGIQGQAQSPYKCIWTGQLVVLGEEERHHLGIKVASVL